MIRESGRIVAIEADCVWVETMRKTTCNSCAAQKGCGHGILNKLDSNRSHHVRVLLGEMSPVNLKVNDQIEIGIPEHLLVNGALFVYFMPLLAMLVGAIGFTYVWSGDVFALAGALSGLIIGFGYVKLHGRNNQNNPNLQPKLLRPIDSVVPSLAL